MGRVLIVRNHGEFLVALQTEEKPRKLSVLTPAGKTINVNPHQVVYRSDLYLHINEFENWAILCEGYMESINLREVWEVIQGEIPFVSLEQLAELVLNSQKDSAFIISLALILYRMNPYFVQVEENWLPNTPEAVEAYFVKEAEIEEVNVDRQALISWLKGESSNLILSKRQQEWVTCLQTYVVYGERHSSKDPAKRLLREIGIESSDPQRQAFELLVGVGIFHPDEPINLYRQQLSLEFPLAVRERAKFFSSAKTKLAGASAEWSQSTVISIDERTTKDIDDALSLQKTDQGFLLGIHITDATELVPFGDVIDQEALKRMATLYLPEITFPMLPESLSEGAGSLLPRVNRAVLSVIVQLDSVFNIISWDIRPSVIKNSASFSYRDVDLILAGKPSSYQPMLDSLQLIAKEFQAKRVSQGALEISRPELKISFDKFGAVGIDVSEGPSPSRKLVAEFMVLANHLMAKFCKDNKIPAIYRSQERLLTDDLAGLKAGPVLDYLIIRRLRPSSIGLNPSPHALLGLPVYIQATSPLRRYPDLVMQRQLRSFIDSREFFYSRDSLQMFIYDAETQIREIGRLEENRKRHWLFRFLSNRIGTLFSGIVLENRDKRALVEIDGIALRAGCFITEPMNPGDRVVLELQEVDIWKSEARFALAR